jgi:hypothetical protein
MRGQKKPAPWGSKRGASGTGFCDRQPRRVNLSSFKARQLGEKGRPKGTF